MTEVKRGKAVKELEYQPKEYVCERHANICIHTYVHMYMCIHTYVCAHIQITIYYIVYIHVLIYLIYLLTL